MAARMVSGVRRSEHITPVLKDLHWLPVSQRVVFMTALVVWKCVHGVSPAYLSDLCVYRYCQVVNICDLQRLALYWFHAPGCNCTTKFRSQRTSHMEPSATMQHLAL